MIGNIDLFIVPFHHVTRHAADIAKFFAGSAFIKMNNLALRACSYPVRWNSVTEMASFSNDIVIKSWLNPVTVKINTVPNRHFSLPLPPAPWFFYDSSTHVVIVTRSPPAVENENRRFATFNPDRWTLAFVAIETATTPRASNVWKCSFLLGKVV